MNNYNDFSRYRCPHCKGIVIKSEIPQYFAQCLNCDEDFYRFELIKKGSENPMTIGEMFVQMNKNNIKLEILSENTLTYIRTSQRYYKDKDLEYSNKFLQMAGNSAMKRLGLLNSQIRLVTMVKDVSTTKIQRILADKALVTANDMKATCKTFVDGIEEDLKR